MKWNQRTFVYYLCLAYAFLFISYACIYSSAQFQWDLRVYIGAVNAWLRGVSPYDTAAMGKAGISSGPFSFVYLPLVIPLWLPFAFLPLRVGAGLWVLGKVFAVAVTYRVWKFFVPGLEAKNSYFLPFALFCANSALVWDISSGNITVYQSLLLWVGLYFLAQEKYFLFVLFLVLGSLFKLQPIALAGLLFILAGKRSFPPFVLAVLGLLGFFACNYLFFPGLTKEFLHEALVRVGGDRGSSAPSLLLLVMDVFKHLAMSFRAHGGGERFAIDAWAKIFYGAAAFGILASYIYSYIRRNGFHRVRKENISTEIFSFLLLFFAIAPRVKNYDNLFLIPVFWYVLKLHEEKYQPLLGFLFCIPWVFSNDPEASFHIYTSPHLGPVSKTIYLSMEYAPYLMTLYSLFFLTRYLQKRVSGLRQSKN